MTLPESPTWMRHAACKEHNVDYWFPDKGQSDIARAAIAVCHTCPVLPQCLTYALDQPVFSDSGIWGGTTAQQRRTIRRRRRQRGAA